MHSLRDPTKSAFAPAMEPRIDARTGLAALIGDPVEHSLSPLIHNTAFRAAGLNHVYLALRVDRAEVEAAVRGMRALGFLGASVTAPHKQAVIPVLDEMTLQASDVGAVNTIVRRGTRLIGDNTDVAGFLEPLNPLADELHGGRMLVIGAGGAARAVVYALLTTFQPERLTLAARTPTRAERPPTCTRPRARPASSSTPPHSAPTRKSRTRPSPTWTPWGRSTSCTISCIIPKRPACSAMRPPAARAPSADSRC